MPPTPRATVDVATLEAQIKALEERLTKALEPTAERAERLEAVEDMARESARRIEEHSGYIVDVREGLAKARQFGGELNEIGMGGIETRLARVMGQARRVEKTETHPRFNYKYAGVEQVMEAVNKALADEHVILVPRILKIERMLLKQDGTYHRTTIWMTYTFRCSAGELGPIEWEAEADDTQDKGRGKALTAARKTFLRDFFLISFGKEDGEGDPDRNEDSGRHAPEPAPRSQQRPAQRQARPPAARPAPAAEAPAPVDPVTQARRQAVAAATKAAGLKFLDHDGKEKVNQELLGIVSAVALPEREEGAPLTPGQTDVLLDALSWVRAAHEGDSYEGPHRVPQPSNPDGVAPYLAPEAVTDPGTLTEVVGEWRAARALNAEAAAGDAAEAASP